MNVHTKDPKRSEDKLTWRARLTSFKNVGPLLLLVWKASPQLVLATALLRLTRSLVPLAALWIPKLILDAVVTFTSGKGGDVRRIWMLVALELGLAVSTDVLGRITALVDGLLGDSFSDKISVRLMRHAAALDLSSFENPLFHDKLERARQISGRIPLLASVLNIGQDILTLFSLSAGLFIFSPWLVALLVAAVVPAFLGETYFSTLTYSLLKRRTPHRRQLDYLRTLAASPQSAKEVKIFGLGEHLTERYERVSKDIYLENKKLAIKRTMLGSALSLIATSGYYGAYATVLVRTLDHQISVGTLVFLAGAFARSRSQLERILSGLNDISAQALFVKDLFELLQMEPTIRSRQNALVAPRPIRDGYEFRDVAFAYPGSDQFVIQKVNFRIHPAERIALIGENGAGKTTLVKLLARLYDPTLGCILLDGVDLREYDVEDLRREIGVIFQDYVRFDMIARENIGFGKIDSILDLPRISKAAEKSLASGVIERLPLGYDQMLGRRFEGGVDLSGGEWQKFALGRAYMRDAQLLILDEPTATLDAKAEYEVFQRFVDLTRDRMAVLISHRFSTVRMADRILVLDQGEICEEGTHKDLVGLGGRYAGLFELQAAGYR